MEGLDPALNLIPENISHIHLMGICGTGVGALAGAATLYVSMPQAQGHFFVGDSTSLVVTGTHGKTTTSAILATLLNAAGRSPGFMI